MKRKTKSTALVLVAMMILSISIGFSCPRTAFAGQEDKSAGDGARQNLSGQTLAEMLGTDEPPMLRLMSASVTTRYPASVWGVKFAQGMTDGQVAHGVDVSVWQGANDFSAAAANGVQFAIIRCGYGNDEAAQDDSRWISNVKQCMDCGIPFGVYIYSYATDKAMARSEAAHVIRQLNVARSQLGLAAADITYPVYIDFEDPSQATLSRSDVHGIINAFASKVKEDSTWGSVDVGFYSFRKWCEDDAKLNTLKTFKANGKEYRYSRWVAEWGTNKAGCVHELHNNAEVAISPTWYDIWQVSTCEKNVAGIGGGGYADIDFAYRAFPIDISGTVADVSIDTAIRAYSGEPWEPSVSVSYGRGSKKGLFRDADYTVSYSDNMDTGTASVTVCGIGGYKGSITRTFKIEPADMSQADAGAVPDQSWTGKPLEPFVSISFNGKVLEAGRDYTVSYSANTDVGTATAVVSGKGNFKGSISIPFSIVHADLKDAEIAKPAPETWTGAPIVPEPDVSFEGEELIRGADYELSWSDNVDVGTGTVSVAGLGRFAGMSRDVKFEILPRDIAAAVMADIPAQLVGISPVADISYEGEQLIEGLDFSVSYDRPDDTGVVRLTVRGIGGYSGTRTSEFKTVTVLDEEPPSGDLAQAAVQEIAPVSFTGGSVHPAVSVSLPDGTPLVLGRDYTVSYGENIRAGEAAGTVVLEGLGKMAGRKIVRFDIVPRDISEASFSFPGLVYTGEALTPDLVASYAQGTLKAGLDYAVSFSSNKNAGTAKATITGHGDFTGETVLSFPILKRDLAEASATLPVQSYTGLPVRPDVKLMWDGHELSNGDYTLSYSSNVDAGLALATAAATGSNWYGKLVIPYEIMDDGKPSYCEDVLGAGRGKLYEISLSGDASKVVDIAGGSASSGANCQVWGANKTAAQRYSISFSRVSGNRGYYTVKSVASGKALDVRYNSYDEGANVWQWDANRSEAQRWSLTRMSDGAYAVQNPYTKKVLTARGASDGANMEMRGYDGRLSQEMGFAEVKAALPDGTYQLASSVDTTYVLDVSCASKGDCANVQVWRANATQAQAFRLEYDGRSGYYTVTNAGSGKVLDVANGSRSDGANIWQYSRNGSKAQKWSIEKRQNGGYILRSALNGSALDLSGARAADGGNVHLWHVNGTAAQSWLAMRL